MWSNPSEQRSIEKVKPVKPPQIIAVKPSPIITREQAAAITSALARAIQSAITKLADEAPRFSRVETDAATGETAVTVADDPGGPFRHPNADQFEALYTRLKNRLLEDLKVDPVFVRLLAQAPEIEVTIEPNVIELTGASLKGRIARLMAAGFFSEPRTQGATRTELKRTGAEPNTGQLSTSFSEFVRDGFLVRDGNDYTLAPGVKVTEKRITT